MHVTKGGRREFSLTPLQAVRSFLNRFSGKMEASEWRNPRERSSRPDLNQPRVISPLRDSISRERCDTASKAKDSDASITSSKHHYARSPLRVSFLEART